ncbi:hypothetical protein A1OC_00882 [Stenotrophomonas maltophilia Ab55555]|nr:hypothetical protein A1OC_00882 [Stenotrophomonas maltophilia Ab55555]
MKPTQPLEPLGIHKPGLCPVLCRAHCSCLLHRMTTLMRPTRRRLAATLGRAAVGQTAAHLPGLFPLLGGTGSFAPFLHGPAKAFATCVVTGGFEEFVSGNGDRAASGFVHSQFLARFRRCASPAAHRRRLVPFPQGEPSGSEGQKGGVAARAVAVAIEPKRSPPSDEARARVFLVVTPRPRKAPTAALSNGGALAARPPATPRLPRTVAEGVGLGLSVRLFKTRGVLGGQPVLRVAGHEPPTRQGQE